MSLSRDGAFKTLCQVMHQADGGSRREGREEVRTGAERVTTIVCMLNLGHGEAGSGGTAVTEQPSTQPLQHPPSSFTHACKRECTLASHFTLSITLRASVRQLIIHHALRGSSQHLWRVCNTRCPNGNLATKTGLPTLLPSHAAPSLCVSGLRSHMHFCVFSEDEDGNAPIRGYILAGYRQATCLPPSLSFTAPNLVGRGGRCESRCRCRSPSRDTHTQDVLGGDASLRLRWIPPEGREGRGEFRDMPERGKLSSCPCSASPQATRMHVRTRVR